MNVEYTSALGIETGDHIRTSWNTGPYIVRQMTAPKRTIHYVGSIVILPHPVTSTIMLRVGQPDRGPDSYAYISEIRRIYINGSPRYYNGANEIFVTKTKPQRPLQIGLFQTEPEPEPYAFQPGVDYHCLDGELWSCPRCKIDYNALTVPTIPDMIPGDTRGRYPPCPTCDAWPICLYVIHPGEERWTSFQVQANIRLMEQYAHNKPERIAHWLEFVKEGQDRANAKRTRKAKKAHPSSLTYSHE